MKKFVLSTILLSLAIVLVSCGTTEIAICSDECEDIFKQKAELVTQIHAHDATDIKSLITKAGCDNLEFDDPSDPSGTFVAFPTGNYSYSCANDAAIDLIAQEVGQISVDRAVIEREVQVLQDRIDEECQCEIDKEIENLELEEV